MTLDEIHHCFKLLEEDWVAFKDDPTMQLQTTLTGMMILVGGFLGASSWGEELPMLELGAIQKDWEEAVFHPRIPHVPLVLSG